MHLAQVDNPNSWANTFQDLLKTVTQGVTQYKLTSQAIKAGAATPAAGGVQYVSAPASSDTTRTLLLAGAGVLGVILVARLLKRR